MPIIVKIPTIAGICEPNTFHDQLSMQTIIAWRLACFHVTGVFFTINVSHLPS